jgi:hypothetical protein
MPPTRIRFEPTSYSIEELQFLLTNIEEPPVVIREMSTMPNGVVRKQVFDLITQCFDLDQLWRSRDIPWAGYERIKYQIARTLSWYTTCAELKRRGGPVHPSMHTWDGNRYTPRGIGSDSSQVTTEILANGSRQKLGLDLNSPSGDVGGPDLIGAAPWLGTAGEVPDLMTSTPSTFIVKENPAAGTGNIICPICEKSESYTLSAVNSKNGARARMMKHCKQMKMQKDAHLILHSRMSGKSMAV